MIVVPDRGVETDSELLKQVIAMLGGLPISTRNGVEVASDLFVMPEGRTIESRKYEDVLHFLEANRLLKWQNEISHLLETRTVSIAGIKKVAGPNNQEFKQFLADRGTDKKRALDVPA